MKKTVLFLFILVLILSLCSCELLQANLFGSQENNETKQDDTTNQSQNPTGEEDKEKADPSGEDPIEVIPGNEDTTPQEDPEDKTEDETTGEEGKEKTDEPKKDTTSSNYYYSAPQHTHVFDQKIASDAYATGITKGSEIEYYYYSCATCGARGTETFEHHHWFKEEVPDEKYKAVAEDEYYYSCVCGKYTTANGTFKGDMKISQDEKGYGDLVTGKPNN